jgi:hypothetical protein
MAGGARSIRRNLLGFGRACWAGSVDVTQLLNSETPHGAHGRRVTTHWRYAQDLAQRYPALIVDAGAIFLKDGPFYTSAGITAGIDLTLPLIEEDYGLDVALTIARELVVRIATARAG